MPHACGNSQRTPGSRGQWVGGRYAIPPIATNTSRSAARAPVTAESRARSARPGCAMQPISRACCKSGMGIAGFTFRKTAALSYAARICAWMLRLAASSGA